MKKTEETTERNSRPNIASFILRLAGLVLLGGLTLLLTMSVVMAFFQASISSLRGVFEVGTITISLVFITVSFVHFIKRRRRFYWYLLAGLILGIGFAFGPELFSGRLPAADEFTRPVGILFFFALMYFIPFWIYSRQDRSVEARENSKSVVQESSTTAESEARRSLLERCPHCGNNVMFASDICPNCQMDRQKA